MLCSINLSLSSACGANCIFCPKNRGKRIKQKFMPFEYVKKIIEEITSSDFKKYHNVIRILIGENGDAFLNKDIIKILRFIKLRMPDIFIEVNTNFQNFTKDKAEIILKENLLDHVICNIDGSTKKNYFNVKKIDLDNTMENITDFLRIRNEIKSILDINIVILSLRRYIDAIYNNLGFYPDELEGSNLIKIEDDTLIIKKQLEKILDLSKDSITVSDVFGWAERDRIDVSKINYTKYSCPNLPGIEKEIYIAPDGTGYACCFDSNYELDLGNVIDSSVMEVFNGEKRKELIKLLRNKEFANINGPCKTVNCCQRFNP